MDFLKKSARAISGLSFPVGAIYYPFYFSMSSCTCLIPPQESIILYKGVILQFIWHIA